MQQTVLVTGATSGIGKELAELFAKDGDHVVIVARSYEELYAVKKELESKYQVRVFMVSMDLTLPDAPSLLMKELHSNGITIDVLVNNAGFGIYGSFAETSLEDELSMIDLHVRTMTSLTKYVLPYMLDKRRGGIINVASTAAFQPGPLMAVYYATKSYTLSFTEALASELRGKGVQVTALCPGPTETRFSERARLLTVQLFRSGSMKAHAVAVQGYQGFKRGQITVIPGLRNRVMAWSVRFTPRKLVLGIVKYLHSSR